MRFTLGKFELQKASRRLSFDGEPVPVGQLGIDILLCLIERHGEVASKSELLQAIWPGEPANESRLVKQISLLRRSIESPPGAPSIIETIPGSGYRTDRWEVSCPDVSAIEVADQAASREASADKGSPAISARGIRAARSTEANRRSRWRGWLRRHWRWALPSAPLVLVLIHVFLTFSTYVLVTAFNKIERSFKFGPSGIVKARSNQGFKRRLNFSRDGRVLAYYQSTEPDGVGQLLMVNLSDQSVAPLPGSGNADEEIAWSPDNRSIALLLADRDGGARRQLSISSLDRRAVRTIAKVAAGGIDWAPNGRQFAVCDQIAGTGQPDSGSIRIHLLAADGSSRRLATDKPTQGRVIDSRPRFSPDGSRLAFLRRHLADQSLEIRLVDLAEGEERQLIQERGEISDLDWSPDGDEVLFLSDRSGRPQLWRLSTVDRAARPSPDQLPLISDPVRSFSISDGGDLAYVRLPDNQSQIDLTPLPEGPLISLFDRRQGPGYVPCTICSSNSTFAPAFSPDGSQIAFLSTQSGAEEIWIANTDCTNYRQLTSLNPSDLNSLTWSGDGTRIAFDQRIGDQFDLFYVDLAGGQIHRLTDTTGDESSPVWSRSSGAIYYSWQRKAMERQARQIRRLDLTTNQIDLLVEKSEGRLAVSSSEQHLYFTREDWVWRIDLQTGEERRLAHLDKASRRASWGFDRDYVYQIRRQDSAMPALFRSDLHSGRMENVAELDTPVSKSNPGFAISPNGQALAITSISPSAKQVQFLKYPE